MSDLQDLLKEKHEDIQPENTSVGGVLKVIGVLCIILGAINLLFMGPMYGVCRYTYSSCTFSEYEISGIVLGMGVGGFLSLGITGVLFLGFSNVIKILEEIRDKR